MEHCINYGKEQLEGTLKEDQDTNKGDQDEDANIRKVQESITKEEEQEAINPPEQQVVTMEDVKQVITVKLEKQQVSVKEERETAVTVWSSLHEATPLLVKVKSPGVIIKVKKEVQSDTSEVVAITQEEQQITIKEEEQELPVTVWTSLYENTPLPVQESPGTSNKVKEETQSDTLEATCITQEEQNVTIKEEQELPVTVWTTSHENAPLLVQVLPGTSNEVKEETPCDTLQSVSITQEEQQVAVKEEQELPVTVWTTSHENTPLLVQECSGTSNEVKEESKSEALERQDTQTLITAVQENNSVNPTVKKDCLMMKSKPLDLSCIPRERSAQNADWNPAEIEVSIDVDDLSSCKQDVLYPRNGSPSEKRCQRKTAGSGLVNENSPRKRKKGLQCSSNATVGTADILGQDNAENVQEKAIGTSEMSVPNRRTFALSVLRDQCLKVITQWYMGQPFSEIVHTMNMNPDSVRHILHVWCTEKRLACHKPSQSKIKGKGRTRKGQVPTLWKWRFLVAVGKNFTLQCMVCDKRLNSSKMDNIACHIRNWHPYSAELPHRVRRAIHQAWKRRQQGLHKVQGLQANCTEQCEMTSLQSEEDKMMSLSLNMQQNELQKPEQYPHVLEIKKTINDRILCSQAEDYTVQHVGHTEENRESDPHQNNIQSTGNKNNIKQTASKKQRQIRYFQDQWRQKYLVDYDWKAEEVVCLVCGLRMRCLRSCTFERHAQRRHPESIHYSEEIRNALWESWNTGQHRFPLLNAANGMSDFKMSSVRKESQPRLIKNCDQGLQEWLGGRSEALEKTRLQAVQDKAAPVVQHKDRPSIRQRSKNSLHVQEQRSIINKSRLNNPVEDYSVQYTTHYADKEPDTHFKQPDIQHIWNTHMKQNDSPKVLLQKQKQMRNFQEHWRQKYLVDYDWKTEEAVCILCGLHMRSLRSCTFERHVQRRHPESVHYPEETRIALWKTWSKVEHSYPLHQTGSNKSDPYLCQDEVESQPSMSTEEYMVIQEENTEEYMAIKQEERSQNSLPDQEQQNTISEHKLNNQIEDYTLQYARHYQKKDTDIHLKHPDIQHIWNIHREQNYTPQMLSKKQKHMRNFQEHWRQKYLVDYDWKTEEAVCILCGLHMRSLRNCTFERHAQRRHPESVHYPEETRIALWKTWSKGGHSYSLHKTRGIISDLSMWQNEMESQPSWQENHEPSMNTEEYMAIQQEQIENVLKSTNTQHEVYS